MTISADHKGLPKYVSTDKDPLFRFHGWLANLRILEVEEIKARTIRAMFTSVRQAIDRTIREELLDRLLFWKQLDLERKLSNFRVYFNLLLGPQRDRWEHARRTKRQSERTVTIVERLSLDVALSWLVPDTDSRLKLDLGQDTVRCSSKLRLRFVSPYLPPKKNPAGWRGLVKPAYAVLDV